VACPVPARWLTDIAKADLRLFGSCALCGCTVIIIIIIIIMKEKSRQTREHNE